jgi:hypothetical protein
MVEARLQELGPKIRTRQEAYRARTGRYWQGLVTHSVIPADGIAAPADRLAEKPADVAESWADGHDPGSSPGEVLAATEPMALRIDVYDGPAGHGYVVTALVRHGAEVWGRSWNVGAEVWREADWALLEPG